MVTRKSQILIVLIILIVAVFTVAAVFLYSGATYTKLAKTNIDKAQAETAALSGIEIARLGLSSNSNWPGTSFTLGEADVAVGVTNTTEGYLVTSQAEKSGARSITTQIIPH